MEIDKKVIKDSIAWYGITTQSIVCMEECGELIQAISKILRGKNNKDNLIEEIADVLRCIELLKEMYGITDEDIKRYIKYKDMRTKLNMDFEAGKINVRR